MYKVDNIYTCNEQQSILTVLLMALVANPANFIEFFLTQVYHYTDVLSCTVKLRDEVCVSPKKKTVVTTQEVHKSVVHCFIPLKM